MYCHGAEIIGRAALLPFSSATSVPRPREAERRGQSLNRDEIPLAHQPSLLVLSGLSTQIHRSQVLMFDH